MNIVQLTKIHEDTAEKCLQIMLKKNSDYTGGEKSTDVFANFKMSEMLGIDPILGLTMRVLDKIQRIRSFANDGQLQVDDESVYDACEDIINYMVLAKAMFIERRENKNEDSV